MSKSKSHSKVMVIELQIRSGSFLSLVDWINSQTRARPRAQVIDWYRDWPEDFILQVKEKTKPGMSLKKLLNSFQEHFPEVAKRSFTPTQEQIAQQEEIERKGNFIQVLEP